MLLVALLVTYLPGLTLLLALGVRRAPLLLGLPPAISVGLAGLAAVATAVTGTGFGLVSMAGMSLLIVVVAGVVTQLGRRTAWSREPSTAGSSNRSTVDRTVRVVSVVTVLGGAAVGVLTWLRLLGNLSTVPQEHDMIIHVLQTAYIARTGAGAPWQVMPADVLTGEPVAFYPAGFHLLAASVAGVTGSAVDAVNAMTVVLLAVALSLSAASLTAVAARQLRLPPLVAALAAGLAALVAAGLYRPTFALMHDGGILPNAATLSMAPGVIAGILLLPVLDRRAAIAVGLACAGLVLVHPSAVMTVALTVLAWWAGHAGTRRGRAELRHQTHALFIVGVVATIVVAPVLLEAVPAAGQTASFPPDIPPTPFGEAVGSTFGLVYGGYFDPQSQLGQAMAAILVAVGVAAIVALRRGFGPVAAWVVWCSVTIAAFLTPGTGIESPVTAFFYNTQVRIWSHVSLLVPVLVGLGLAISSASVAVWLRRRVPLPVGWSTVALALLVWSAYLTGPATGYADTNVTAVASRYSAPHFSRVDSDDLTAIDWLAERVKPGQRVLNSPNDGSTYLYVEHGVSIVNVFPLGLAAVPYSYELLDSFAAYPAQQELRDMLLQLNVAWIYVDADAPRIGTAGSPEGWAGTDGLSTVPGFTDLDGLPGLSRVFQEGSVRVYRLDLDVVAALGPQAVAR